MAITKYLKMANSVLKVLIFLVHHRFEIEVIGIGGSGIGLMEAAKGADVMLRIMIGIVTLAVVIFKARKEFKTK